MHSPARSKGRQAKAVLISFNFFVCGLPWRVLPALGVYLSPLSILLGNILIVLPNGVLLSDPRSNQTDCQD